MFIISVVKFLVFSPKNVFEFPPTPLHKQLRHTRSEFGHRPIGNARFVFGQRQNGCLRNTRHHRQHKSKDCALSWKPHTSVILCFSTVNMILWCNIGESLEVLKVWSSWAFSWVIFSKIFASQILLTNVLCLKKGPINFVFFFNLCVRLYPFNAYH